ncbi:hypothetical protein ACLOJK_030572 [Asimina triloba]
MEYRYRQFRMMSHVSKLYPANTVDPASGALRSSNDITLGVDISGRENDYKLALAIKEIVDKELQPSDFLACCATLLAVVSFSVKPAGLPRSIILGNAASLTPLLVLLPFSFLSASNLRACMNKDEARGCIAMAYDEIMPSLPTRSYSIHTSSGPQMFSLITVHQDDRRHSMSIVVLGQQ